MSIRWWRRLAGCFVIKLAAAAGAADFQYKAGTASVGQAQAIAWEDRRGNRAALGQTEAALTLATADFVAVQVMRRYELERQSLLIRGAKSGTANPEDLVHAIAAALGAMEPAVLRFGGGQLSVTASDGQCRAAVTADGALRFGACGGGEVVRSPIRAAFRVVEPEHGLERRGEVPPAHPLQAIGFGRQVVILGLGGAGTQRFHLPGVIVATYANESAPPADDGRVSAAVRELLRRVGR